MDCPGRGGGKGPRMKGANWLDLGDDWTEVRRRERSVSKAVPSVDADEILRELTVRQHLAPHRRLADVVAEMIERTGACPVAAERAMERLELDGNRPIGRLKRGELIQFARGMYRLWAQALAAEANQSSARVQGGGAGAA